MSLFPKLFPQSVTPQMPQKLKKVFEKAAVEAISKRAGANIYIYSEYVVGSDKTDLTKCKQTTWQLNAIRLS